MRIGIPREIKTLEGRVALVPAACAELVAHGHEVWIEPGAGLASGYADADYAARGVRLGADAAEVWAQAELLVKVKEPQPEEVQRLRAGQRLFCFLHLAAAPALLDGLVASGADAIAFETVQTADGLPVLAPMSTIAGRIATQVGATLLQRPQGGRGLLLGGLAGSARGEVVVVGGGVAGGQAAAVAAALGARVSVFDRKPERMAAARALGSNVEGLYSYPDALEQACAQADLVIGAVLIPGALAPRVITRAMVEAMPEGAVLVDISVDQGGCTETTRPTSYAEPTFVEAGVTHFCVTNMPGAVPRTASQALSAVLTPYVLRLTQPDWRDDAALAAGLNVSAGRVVHPALTPPA